MKNGLQILKKAIKKGSLACEKHSTLLPFQWHGHEVVIGPLFCSYGQIGYTIQFDGESYQYDYESNKIEKV
jgi:hypothetical protein